MKDNLRRLLLSLSPDQKNKELVELECTEDLLKIIGDQRISISTSGKAKELFFAGLGKTESYEGKVELVYKNRQGKLVVKPKLIQEFLDGE